MLYRRRLSTGNDQNIDHKLRKYRTVIPFVYYINTWMIEMNGLILNITNLRFFICLGFPETQMIYGSKIGWTSFGLFKPQMRDLNKSESFLSKSRLTQIMIVFLLSFFGHDPCVMFCKRRGQRRLCLPQKPEMNVDIKHQFKNRQRKRTSESVVIIHCSTPDISF